MSSTNLTIMATYWNERDWIGASLAQIDALSPREAFICDGCFDPKIENHSTDGTTEIIEEWVTERPWAHLVQAKRVHKLNGLWKLFGNGMHAWNLPLRVIMFFFYLRTNIYRINQAVTFKYMMGLSKHRKTGNWFMHIDADQFYPDEMIGEIKEACNTDTDIDLLTADEQTFFTNFNTYTTQYEKRNYNNMPYKLGINTIITPTRDIVNEQYPKPIALPKDRTTVKRHLGKYFHYKFRPYDRNRVKAGYRLGDRVCPDYSKYQTEQYTGKHPKVIQELARDPINKSIN